MANATDVLRVAAGEIGYSRWTDPQTGSKYGRWYAELTGSSYFAQNGVPFCAMFVSYVLNKAGASCAGFPGAGCTSAWRTAKSKGAVLSSKYNAQAGDIILFDWDNSGDCDHVGIVEINKGSYVQTIEGNTSSGTSGSQSNGGGVYRRTRSWGVVRAIIRPNYGSANNTSSSTGTTSTSTPIDTNASLTVDGYFGRNTVAKLQKTLGTYVDGVVSAQPTTNKQYLASCVASGAWQFTDKCGGGSSMVAALQNKLGTTPDGWFGLESIKALQRYLGTTVDGTLDEGSPCVMELQNRLNAGTFMNGTAQTTVKTANIEIDGWWGKDTTSALQTQLGGTVDGVVSGQAKSNVKYMTHAGNGWEWNDGDGSPMIQKLQSKVGSTADGYIGPNTIKKLQSYLGVSVDGICGNDTVCALQKALNNNKFK
jgi:lysozyme family protein